MRKFRFSLTFAILASLSCLLIFTWLLLSLISFKTSEKDLLAQKNEEGRLLLSAFLHLLPENHSTGVGPAAHRFAMRLAAERFFRGIIVLDRNGRELYRVADSRKADARLRQTLDTGAETASLSENGLLLSRYSAIRTGDQIVGVARLTLSLAPEYERLSRTRTIFLSYFLLDFLLLLVFGSYLLSRCIVLPIRQLLAVTGKIADGDLSSKVPVPGNKEIAELAESFNGMLVALRKKKDEVDEHIQSLERINNELQIARQETIRSEKMASVGLLAAGTAHEIGTPLAAIIGYAGILRDEVRDDPEKSDYLARIEAEAGRIDRIIHGLLDYARPSRRDWEEVDMREVLQSTIDMLDGQGIFKNTTVSLSAEATVPLVKADRQELLQVFTNLFINARDAMQESGTLTICVTVDGENHPDAVSRQEKVVRGRRKDDFRGAFFSSLHPRDKQHYLRVDVSDTGVGIEPENLEKIFDPFFTTKEPGKGTGLGLAVTARIVDSLGGRITVESSLKSGTTFSVWLPVPETI
ncbi:MAG: HAMP domain-containing sensor histidine kinase [Deltaproteobacteria bacterium]|nr:HAMP domain-containing sensor histidine kinase [Deltaproteobacteria bacterium]TLN05151.1 MAG: HAMP domain-containing protein [bacterium]